MLLLLPNDMIRYILTFIPDYNHPILSLIDKRFYNLTSNRKANLAKLVKKGKLKLLRFIKEDSYWSTERLNQLLVVAVKSNMEIISIWLLELGASDIDRALKKGQVFDTSILIYYKFRSDIEAVKALPHWKDEWISTVVEAKRFISDLRKYRNMSWHSIAGWFNTVVYNLNQWMRDSEYDRPNMSNRIIGTINFNPKQRLEESESESDDDLDLDLTQKFKHLLNKMSYADLQ